MSESSSNEEAAEPSEEQKAATAQEGANAGAGTAETPAVDGPPIKPLDQHAP